MSERNRRSRNLCLLSALYVAAVLVLLGASGAEPAPSLGDCPLRFAVIGDRTGTAIAGKYEEILLEVERLQPELAITVGDMIEGYTGDTTEIKRQWQEYREIVRPLTMPLYFTPGNHDITQPEVMDQYRRMMGEPHHSFDVRGVHFVVLDNGRYPTVRDFPEEQLAWLTDDLARHQDAAYTFVFFHIPYWLDTVAKGASDPLHDIFVRYGVDGVFTGHNHDYFSGRYDGIMYTGVGASGAETTPGLTGLEHHFVWVTVGVAGIAIAPIKIGSVRPWEEVTAKDIILVYKIQSEAIEVSQVPVGEALTCPETPVKVTVKNIHSDRPLSVSVKWRAPDGWTVTPGEKALEIAPLASGTAEFTVASTASLYPVPIVSIDYTIADGLTRELERSLPIARTVYAYKAGRPPKIDGVIDEDVWRAPVTAFFAPDGAAVATDPVRFYFAWDRSNLYVAARCTEKEMGSIVADCKVQDCTVYAEDCVGYFLEPETADGPVYQIYFNPLGTAFDQKITVKGGWSVETDAKWNGRYEVKTSKGADSWSIEARIPLKALATTAKPGKHWKLNFRRKQKRLGTSADWQVPVGYDPVNYGVLELK